MSNYYDNLVMNIGHHELYLYLKIESEEILLRVRKYYLHSIYKEIQEQIGDLDKNLVSESSKLFLFKNKVIIKLEKKINDYIKRFEFRKGQNELVEEELKKNNYLEIKGIYFPNLDDILNEWLNDKKEKKQSFDVKRTIFFITNIPQEKSMVGTQTNIVLPFFEIYLKKNYSDIKIQDIDPLQANPYDYNHLNEYFRIVKKKISDIRTKAVEEYEDKWKNYFIIYISANTGTIPIIFSIYYVMRHYEVNYIILDQAHKFPILNEIYDVKVISKHKVEHFQPLLIENINDINISKGIKKLKNFKNKYEKLFKNNEIDDFWHRKTHQYVLAVLCYKIKDDYYYECSVNMEVSMPTGSLCAERNAIGSALSKHPQLKLQDFKFIMVYSLKHNDSETLNPLQPCGACREWLIKIAEVNPGFSVVFFDENISEVYIKEVNEL